MSNAYEQGLKMLDRSKEALISLNTCDKEFSYIAAYLVLEALELTAKALKDFNDKKGIFEGLKELGTEELTTKVKEEFSPLQIIHKHAEKMLKEEAAQ